MGKKLPEDNNDKGTRVPNEDKYQDKNNKYGEKKEDNKKR